MWKERAALEKPSEPFNREKDAQHYDDAPDTSFVVKPGQFAIFSRRMRMPAALGKERF